MRLIMLRRPMQVRLETTLEIHVGGPGQLAEIRNHYGRWYYAKPDSLKFV